MVMRMYISRAETPSQAADHPIGLQEWKNLVREVPGMHLFEGEQTLPDYITPPTASDGLARWSSHPMMEVIWFCFDDGVIYADGYDAYVTMRMRTLALRLGARVMDEKGHFF